LDFNDAFYGAEWTHPSDVIGAILSVSEYVSRLRNERGLSVLSMRDVIVATIKAYEIVGVLALDNSFNQIGVDHLLLTRAAVAAVTTSMLGGGRLEVMYATSQAFIDGSGLRCFRHYPCSGTRKGWAAGDAAARGVSLALMTMRGEMGYLGALSAPVWGFNDVFYRRQDIALKREFGEYIMENVVFKPSFPSEIHAQTAIEGAFRLHPQIVHRVDEVHSVAVHTTRSAVRCIDKTGPLNGPADRDHCLQYAVAVALLYGNMTSDHYEDSVASDPRVDELRRKILIAENPQYSADYVDPDRRSCSNSIQVHFKDRTSTNKFEVEYPVGHRRRRMEGFPALEKKFISSLHIKFPPERAGFIFERVTDAQVFDALTPMDFMELFNATPHPVLLPPMRATPGVFDYTPIDSRASFLVPRITDGRTASVTDGGVNVSN
jgi:2-methylcitrate dehydratase